LLFSLWLFSSPLAFGRLNQAADLAGASLLLVMGALLFLWAGRRASFPPLQLADLGIVLFCLGAAASTARTVDLYATLASVLRFLSYGLAYACARLLAGQDFPALRRLGPAAKRENASAPSPLAQYLLLGGLVGGAFICACVGVRGYLVSAFWLNNPSWRTFGTFYNPNAFAGYLALAAFPAVALLIVARTPLLRASAALALAAIFAALALTASKGGILAFLVAAAAFLSWRLTQSPRPWVKRLNPFALAGLILLAFVVAAFAFPPARLRLLSTLREAHSVLFRWYTWAATMRMALDRPLLGWGLGTYSEVMLRYKIAGFTGMAHNDYLQLWSEGGLLTLFGWLTALTGLALRLRPPFTGSPAARLLQVACGAGVAAFAFHGLVDYDLYIQATGAAAFFLLGSAVSQGQPPPTRERAPRRSRIAAYCAAALAVVYALWGTLASAALLHANVGRNLTLAGQYMAAETELQSAVGLMPANGSLRLEHARHLYTLASHLRDRSTMQRGLDEVRHACRLQPQAAINFRWLGLFNEALGNPSGALLAYARALALNPHYLSVEVAAARIYLRAGDLDAGREALHRVTKIENSLYERVKAVPDLIELDYARAHLYLATLALLKPDTVAAAEEARAARRTTEAYLRSSTQSIIRQSKGEQQQDPGPMLHALTYALEAQARGAQADDAALLWQQARQAYPEVEVLAQRLRKEWILP